ncbi:MAG: site-2 protease family protein, partial [Christensenellales bacterium]
IEDYLSDGTKNATFQILRNDSKLTIAAELTDSGNWCYNGYGVSRNISIVKLPFFQALGRSFGFAFFVVFKILASLGGLLTGKVALSSAGGTITVVKTIAESTMMSFSNLLYVVAIVSANLAVMNLLPIPALDGARMVFTVIEWIRGKPLNRKVEGIIHTVGLILLLVLAVFLDIFHLVS